MSWHDSLPFWPRLTPSQRQRLEAALSRRQVSAGTLLHSGDCAGLFLVEDGRLRAFLTTDEGKEITLYRLHPGEMCLFSAACVLSGAQLDVLVAAETDTQVVHIPPAVYQELMETSAPVASDTCRLMARRFSDVIWLMDQILSRKLDGRLAALLLEERALQGADILRLTHDQLARHLGSAREVVTRMLHYLQDEGLVERVRGGVRLTNLPGLERLAAGCRR